MGERSQIRVCFVFGFEFAFWCVFSWEGLRRGRCGWPYGVAVPCDFSFLFFAPGSGPLSNITDYDDDSN